MTLTHKVGAAVMAGTIWLAAVAPEAGDVPARSLASTTGLSATSASNPGATSAGAPPTGQLHRMADASGAAEATTADENLRSATQTTSGGAARPQATRSGASAAGSASQQPAYDAGGSMSGSSAVSQAYAQTTQNGWGCQAALQYLSQHANPQFQLVCPGYAMGHQAMTCYYLQGECPDTAEIVIADPCPAAYKNEAWNSWHMGTGPYDPYGWCSDWSGERAPITPAPQPPTANPITPAL